MIFHVFLLTSRRFIRFISTSRFSTLLGFLNRNARILKLEYIHASLQVQSCALHLSVGLGACSAALLLARWLQHIAWSISMDQLPFVPRQCLLRPRRGLLVEWFMLWISCWLVRVLCSFLCIGLRFTSLTGRRHIEARALSKTGVIQLHVQFNGAMTVKALFLATLNL